MFKPISWTVSPAASEMYSIRLSLLQEDASITTLRQINRVYPMLANEPGGGGDRGGAGGVKGDSGGGGGNYGGGGDRGGGNGEGGKKGGGSAGGTGGGVEGGEGEAGGSGGEAGGDGGSPQHSSQPADGYTVGSPPDATCTPCDCTRCDLHSLWAAHSAELGAVDAQKVVEAFK
eukprot:814089-Prymnesium_polylepis.1